MDQLQTVFGLFDHVAEAQQAVQLLLAAGFTKDAVTVSTHPHLTVRPGRLPTTTTDADQRRSGRFLVSLFGERQPAIGSGESTPGQSRPGNMLVMVQTQSGTEARQIIDLLERAGSMEVTVRDGKMP